MELKLFFAESLVMLQDDVSNHVIFQGSEKHSFSLDIRPISRGVFLN
jgi:hypothetical protein